MNKIYCRINDGKELELAEVEEGKVFTYTISKFPTKEQLSGIEHYHLLINDGVNKFYLYSKPIEK